MATNIEPEIIESVSSQIVANWLAKNMIKGLERVIEDLRRQIQVSSLEIRSYPSYTEGYDLLEVRANEDRNHVFRYVRDHEDSRWYRCIGLDSEGKAKLGKLVK